MKAVFLFFLIFPGFAQADVISDSTNKLNQALTDLKGSQTRAGAQLALEKLERIDRIPAVSKLAGQIDYATKTVINNDPRYPHDQRFTSQLFGRIVRSSASFQSYNTARDKLITEIQRLIGRGLGPEARAKALKTVPQIKKYSPQQLQLMNWAKNFKGTGAEFAKSIDHKMSALRRAHQRYTRRQAQKARQSREARGEKMIRAPIAVPEIFY